MLKKSLLLSLLCLPNFLNSMGTLLDVMFPSHSQGRTDKGRKTLHDIEKDLLNRLEEQERLQAIEDSLKLRYESMVEKYNSNIDWDPIVLEDDLKNLFRHILKAIETVESGSKSKPDQQKFEKIIPELVAQIMSKKNSQLAKLTESNAELKSSLDKANKDLQDHKRVNEYMTNYVQDLEILAKKKLEREREEKAQLRQTIADFEDFFRAKDAEATRAVQELQEENKRHVREKAELISCTQKEISQIATQATQKHESAMAMIALLRTEVSPLRRELSPLRRKVKTQESALLQKDAEIEQLKQALQHIRIQNEEKNK